jgi:hypothetical protein
VQCEEVLRTCRGSVDDAVDALFALPRPVVAAVHGELAGEAAAPAAPAAEIDPGAPVLVFAYGTLMRGYNNHKNLMGNATFLGLHQTAAKYVVCVGVCWCLGCCWFLVGWLVVCLLLLLLFCGFFFVCFFLWGFCKPGGNYPIVTDDGTVGMLCSRRACRL